MFPVEERSGPRGRCYRPKDRPSPRESSTVDPQTENPQLRMRKVKVLSLNLWEAPL